MKKNLAFLLLLLLVGTFSCVPVNDVLPGDTDDLSVFADWRFQEGTTEVYLNSQRLDEFQLDPNTSDHVCRITEDKLIWFEVYNNERVEETVYGRQEHPSKPNTWVLTMEGTSEVLEVAFRFVGEDLELKFFQEGLDPNEDDAGYDRVVTTIRYQKED